MPWGCRKTSVSRGQLSESGANFTPQSSRGVILCGSCSETTRQQIKAYDGPHFPVDVPSLMNGSVSAESVATQLPAIDAPLIYSSADPESIKALQASFGASELAAQIESFFGELAVRLVGNGYHRLVVAGGETSGAVVSALQLTVFNIGPEIDPGVPALSNMEGTLAAALKSGNFGGEDFFSKALSMLEQHGE
ncbi:MAG: nucleotide-binding domain containing protein [Pseudomonadota bacterium]